MRIELELDPVVADDLSAYMHDVRNVAGNALVAAQQEEAVRRLTNVVAGLGAVHGAITRTLDQPENRRELALRRRRRN